MIPLLLFVNEMVWSGLVLLLLSAAPAASQTIPPAPVAAVSQMTDHRRVTPQERFARANTSHDGRLTLEQARAGYRSVARHFDAIDQAGKGYVTEQDIRAWRDAAREKRRAAKREAEDSLRPRKAYQRAQGGQPTVTTQVIGPHAGPAADLDPADTPQTPPDHSPHTP